MPQTHQLADDGSVRIGRADTISTPRSINPELNSANPDSKVPPLSDVGSLPVFKYPFAFANKRVYAGGWSREVTIRELQVAKELAGVNMRLEAGGVRELHWHKAAEWSFMLYGSARLTAIDAEGRSFVDDVFAGDLWYFPAGIPHSIQGLQPDGAEFLLVFDDGHFSEHETVLLSDIAAHIPREVLAKNFGVATRSLDGIYDQELFIFQAPLPGPLGEDQKNAARNLEPSPTKFSFRPNEQSILKKTKGGEARVIDARTFQVSKTVAVAIVTVHPGGMRELHWHQNADEWQYYISGKARMTIVGTGKRARTMDFEAGDVGYVEKTLPHYIQNTGDEDLCFLEVFRSDRFEDLSFSEWLSHTPAGLVRAHLNIDQDTYDKIPREKLVVLPG